uniref:Zinc finger and BTB domain containing 39 n=1 Tax=Petromyzon marinus TaxID=7757 RepID=S4R7M7_PETMA
ADEQISLSTGKQLSDLLRELSALWLRGSFCDAVVEVQSRRYLAHKAVLSSTCTYFRGIFLDTPCSNMGPFVVDFLTEKTFDQVLDFVYKGNVSVGREDLRELLKAAQSLGIECLEEVCRVFVTDDVEDCFPDKDTDATYISESGQYDCVEQHELEHDLGSTVAGIAFITSNNETLLPHEGGGAFKKRRSSLLSSDHHNSHLCEPPRLGMTDTLPPFRNKECIVICPIIIRLNREVVTSKITKTIYVKTEPNEEPPCKVARTESTRANASQVSGLAVADGRSQETGGFRVTDIAALDGCSREDLDGCAEPGASDLLAGQSAAGAPQHEIGVAQIAAEHVQCQVCGDTMDENISSLREHAAIHVDRETLKCRVCGRGFTTFNNAVQHVYKHCGVTVLACHDCGKTFLSLTRLTLHYLNHCRKKRPPPPLPSVPFVRPLEYRPPDDSGEHHASSYAPCQICGLPVHQKMAYLRSHARSHVDLEHLLCMVCGLKLTCSSNLIKHALLHVGVFLFACPICEKRFAMQCLLQQHQ